MVRSGVKNSPECREVYQELKKNQKYKYIIFKIDPVQLIISPVILGEPTATYDQFQDDLVKTGCAYAVYDFTITLPGGGIRQRIVFFNWAPDDAPPRPKMLQSASIKDMEKDVDGVFHKIQCSEIGEIQESEIIATLIKLSRK